MSHTPILLLNTRVEMQNTLGSNTTITAISKAAEAVITGTHAFSIGDLIVIKSVVGMIEINDRVVRVKSVSTTVSFVAEALDSTAFSTYSSGGTATKVTAFVSFDNITSFTFAEPSASTIDSTTINMSTMQEVFGMDGVPKITLNVISDPVGATMVAVRAASVAKTSRAFRVTLQTGVILIFNAYVSGGRGLDGGVGAIATGTVSLSLLTQEQYFAS